MKRQTLFNRNAIRWLGMAIVLLVGCGREPESSVDTGSVPESPPPAAQRLDLPVDDFRYSFTREPFVHPAIIADIHSRSSDTGDQVVAIDLVWSQRSNRYHGDLRVSQRETGHPSISVMRTDAAGNTVGFNGYQYVGMSDSGVHVFLVWLNYGGSGNWYNLLFATVERDQQGMVFGGWKNPVIRSGDERLLIKKIGQIYLGDRWNGELRITGNELLVGKDKGLSHRLGDITPESWSYNDQTILIDID